MLLTDVYQSDLVTVFCKPDCVSACGTSSIQDMSAFRQMLLKIWIRVLMFDRMDELLLRALPLTLSKFIVILRRLYAHTYRILSLC
nr:MAG: hypothetical protein J07AB56_09250 [Candidatus Nanosalinarum sp. J07AB56]